MRDLAVCYTIRPMEPADVPAVMDIERVSFPTPWMASSFLYELNMSTHSFYRVLLKPVAGEAGQPGGTWRRWLRGVTSRQEESRVIGYAGFRMRSDEAHISTLAVHPDWRGRGLGELLLLTALEQALSLRGSVVSLEVRASNQVAQNLYRKYSFQFARIRRGYYRDGEDAWLMKAELGGDAYRARLQQFRQALEARLLRPQEVRSQS